VEIGGKVELEETWSVLPVLGPARTKQIFEKFTSTTITTQSLVEAKL
jgi:hypothetical protein